MPPALNPKEIDVVILCGGWGKRLRSVINTRPKSMAEIDGRPFLDILIDYVASYGFRRFILCIGYMGNVIKQHYQKGRGSSIILFSEEGELLGTGGAIKNAESLIQSNPFLVMNGDSMCKLNLGSFIDFHLEKEALLSVVLVRSKTARDYGSVTLDDFQRITSYNEKIADGSNNLINAGIYLMQKAIFSHMPAQNRFSLEYDLFPRIIGNRCYGFLTESELIDIGTPERYEKAKSMITTGGQIRKGDRNANKFRRP